MNTRALAIAVIVAVLGTILLVLYQKRFETEASGGERIRVLTAVKRIERGQAITDDSVTVRPVPNAYVEERDVKATELDRIRNLTTLNTLREGEVVRWTDLVSQRDEQRDLASLVQPGFRAITIQVQRDGTNQSLLRPGDYVDVISVLPIAPGSEMRSSRVLLTRVLLLAVGGDTSRDRDESASNKDKKQDATITLSLHPSEAQQLTLAAQMGQLTVALRGAQDPRVDAPPPVGPADIYNQRPAARPAGAAGAATPGPLAPSGGR